MLILSIRRIRWGSYLTYSGVDKTRSDPSCVAQAALVVLSDRTTEEDQDLFNSELKSLDGYHGVLDLLHDIPMSNAVTFMERRLYSRATFRANQVYRSRSA